MRAAPDGRTPDLGLVADGTLLICDGRIEQVGPSRRILNLTEARRAQEIEATGCLVMPGFVDAEADVFGESPTRVSLRRAVERLIEHGTTTISCLLPGTRACKLVERHPPPLTIHFRGRAIPGLEYPLRRYLDRSLEPEEGSRPWRVVASGFHPQRSPACNLQTAASLAVVNGKMTIEAALRAITSEAAAAIGLAAEIGSLEPGKYADLVVLDVSDYREIPGHFGVNLVRAVIRRGQMIYERGEFAW